MGGVTLVARKVSGWLCLQWRGHQPVQSQGVTTRQES